MKTDYEKEFIHQFLLASRRFLGSRHSVFVMTTFEDKVKKCPLPGSHTSSQLVSGCGEEALMLSKQQNMMSHQCCSSKCTNVKHGMVWDTLMTVASQQPDSV